MDVWGDPSVKHYKITFPVTIAEGEDLQKTIVDRMCDLTLLSMDHPKEIEKYVDIYLKI